MSKQTDTSAQLELDESTTRELGYRVIDMMTQIVNADI